MATPTAGDGGSQDQYWPLPKFYFSVDIGDFTDLPFQEVTNLIMEWDQKILEETPQYKEKIFQQRMIDEKKTLEEYSRKAREEDDV